MNSKALKLGTLLGCLLVATAAVADEGMWMPQQVPGLEPNLSALGFEGDARVFADLVGHPMGAIVSLGGCSASFVSPDGLIVTNHHCVTGSLQYNSSPEKNLMEDGLLARSRNEEVWSGPGPRAYVTTEVVEVTDDLNRRTASIATDRARYDAVERFVKERTAACEKDGSRCRVAPFFGGLRWFQIRQTEIQDLRLVWAPPGGIGRFGGETDNWRWPRHTGDFAIYRAYVGPNGKGAPHSKDNVPYRPKRWLKVATKGAAPGEVIFVAGYPGATRRYETAAETAEAIDWQLPRSIRRSTEQLQILDELAKESTEISIKVEARRRGINNGLTKNRGLLEGLVRGGNLATAEERERELRAWISAEPARGQEFGSVLPDMEAIRARASATRDRDATFRALYGQGSLLDAADSLYQVARNRPKPDLDREPEYQARNWTRIQESLERMQKTLDPKVDRAILRYAFFEAARLPAGQRIDVVDAKLGIAAGMDESKFAPLVEGFLDRLYAGTKLFDQRYRLSLFDKSVAQLSATKDPFIDLAATLEPMDERLREERKARQGASYRAEPGYMKALLAQKSGLVPPDANGTLRISFGRVEGVAPRDGLRYASQTTLAGIVEKNTGSGDFDAPTRQLDAIEALRAGKTTPYLDPALGDVPVDFLSTADTTGGNSGSATLNARGELCGLLFDGTYDTVVSDFLYDPRTRSIHADSRYLLWLLSDVEGADALLREIGVENGVR